MKISIGLFIFVMNSSYLFSFFCPCSPDVSYAMGKQRDTLKDRLDDFKSVVKANSKQTKNQTLIIDQEILAYRRLLARVTKETMMLKEASHITTTIKKNSAVDIAIKVGE